MSVQILVDTSGFTENKIYHPDYPFICDDCLEKEEEIFGMECLKHKNDENILRHDLEQKIYKECDKEDRK